jgi:hypothetical protein
MNSLTRVAGQSRHTPTPLRNSDIASLYDNSLLQSQEAEAEPAEKEIR